MNYWWWKENYEIIFKYEKKTLKTYVKKGTDRENGR